MKLFFAFFLVCLTGELLIAQPPEDRYLRQAQNFFERGEYAKADMNCDAGLRRNPKSGKAYLLKAKCQYAWDHHQCNYESKRYLDSADKYSDNKYEVYLMKVINTTCCGEHMKAEFYLKQLEAFEEKDIQYEFVKGYYKYIKHEFEESLLLLNKVLINSKDLTTKWNANYYIGYIFFYQGKYKDAVKSFEACLKTTPNSSEINSILGSTYAKLLDYKQSLSYHNKAVENIEDPSKIQTAIYFYSRGVSVLESGNAKKALKDFYKAIEIGKDDAEMHYYLGKAQMETSDFCGASTSFYESQLKIKGKEKWQYSFHISNIYFYRSYVNVMAYCDNIELEHIEQCEKLFDEEKSEYDQEAIKVIRASFLIQNNETNASATKICKCAKEGVGTKNVELTKIASKIVKTYCSN